MRTLTMKANWQEAVANEECPVEGCKGTGELDTGMECDSCRVQVNWHDGSPSVRPMEQWGTAEPDPKTIKFVVAK